MICRESRKSIEGSGSDGDGGGETVGHLIIFLLRHGIAVAKPHSHAFFFNSLFLYIILFLSY